MNAQQQEILERLANVLVETAAAASSTIVAGGLLAGARAITAYARKEKGVLMTRHVCPACIDQAPDQRPACLNAR